MPGARHLHVDPDDPLGDWMVKILKAASRGSIGIRVGDEQAAVIAIDSGKVAVDLLQPSLFRLGEDETGLFDKLKTASEFGRKLSDYDTTLYFLRRGKEAVRLGKQAKPTLSKLLTKSNDVQLTSVREFGKLKGDLKTD